MVFVVVLFICLLVNCYFNEIVRDGCDRFCVYYGKINEFGNFCEIRNK